MRSLFKPLTREMLLAATRGEAIVFDCMECCDGVYAMRGHAPTCTCCGALAPEDVVLVMRDCAPPSASARVAA